MNEVNFSVRISGERSKRINRHVLDRNSSNKEFVEAVIDNIPSVQRVLDATYSAGKRVRK